MVPKDNPRVEPIQEQQLRRDGQQVDQYPQQRGLGEGERAAGHLGRDSGPSLHFFHYIAKLSLWEAPAGGEGAELQACVLHAA